MAAGLDCALTLCPDDFHKAVSHRPGFHVNPGGKPFRQFHQNASQLRLGLEGALSVPARRHVELFPSRGQE